MHFDFKTLILEEDALNIERIINDKQKKTRNKGNADYFFHQFSSDLLKKLIINTIIPIVI